MDKTYIVWSPLKINDWRYDHVASYDDWFPSSTVWSETEWYTEGSSVDANVYVGVAEYPESYGPQELITLKELASSFKVDWNTPAQTVTLLNTWYPSSTVDYFSLDDDDWTIIDNRPEDDLI